MGDDKKAQIGSIGWLDLTVERAEEVRDFYREVVGWTASPVDMGGYSDFSMVRPGDGEAVAGVCHARGSNAELPPVWLAYVVVEDIDRSAAVCVERGGKVLAGPKDLGAEARYAVIQDPAGAALALYQHKSPEKH